MLGRNGDEGPCVDWRGDDVLAVSRDPEGLNKRGLLSAGNCRLPCLEAPHAGITGLMPRVTSV